MEFVFVELLGFQCLWCNYVCIYLCMFLSQAKSFPPSLGIEWGLFLHVNLVEEVSLEPVVVTCSDVELLFPEVPLLSDHARRGETGDRSEASLLA